MFPTCRPNFTEVACTASNVEQVRSNVCMHQPLNKLSTLAFPLRQLDD